MKLNRSTDMALRVMMLLGARGGRLTVEEIAADLALPRSHVAKVVQRLQRMNLLLTTRGRSGGVAPARNALQVTVGTLVRLFEGADEVVNCDEPPCPLRAACRLRTALARAQSAFFAALDEVPLADLIATPAGPALIGLPRVGMDASPVPVEIQSITEVSKIASAVKLASGY